MTEPRPSGDSPASVTFSENCPGCGCEPGIPGYLRQEVPLGHPDFGRLVPCPVCHAKNLAKRKKFAGKPLEGKLAECTFETFDDSENREALLRCVEFASRPVGLLTLWGGYGRGKTHLLAAIHNRLKEYDVVSKYVSFPDWTSTLRGMVSEEDGRSNPEEFYQYVSGFPIILIDDIDFADIRRWTREQVFRLFNRRYVNRQQVGTVLAMNFDPYKNGELGWLFSRLTDERQVVVQMMGQDNRPRVRLLERMQQIRQALAGKV